MSILMKKKLNFFIEEDIRRELNSLVPAGERSKVINEALKKELLRRKRIKATKKLMALKSKCRKFTSEEIVEALKNSRRRML